MSDWAYFVLVWLPVGTPAPFEASATVLSTLSTLRIFASKPSTVLNAQLLRWRIASVYQCVARVEVIFSPADDPFQTGRD